MNMAGLMYSLYVKRMCRVIKSWDILSDFQVFKGPTSEVSDSPSALRVWPSKDGTQTSPFKREITSYATATTEGGMPASWATLSPWLSLFTPGRKR
jgi:hypothetical protein